MTDEERMQRFEKIAKRFDHLARRREIVDATIAIACELMRKGLAADDAVSEAGPAARRLVADIDGAT